ERDRGRVLHRRPQGGATPARGRVQLWMTRHSVMRTPLAGHENETVLSDCFKRVFGALLQKPSIVPFRTIWQPDFMAQCHAFELLMEWRHSALMTRH
ncbi:hypothetical protein, partial [Gluconobacter albidus]|uniref:hypothetical protein n=1 Tax=Gluconobacter albidus TaxID=318683 RepID=UPI001C3FA3DB